MSEARNNHRSPQYSGPLPDVIPSASTQWLVVPNAAFLAMVKELREGGDTGPIQCHERDRDVILVDIAHWTVPMRSVPQSQWPTSNLQMSERCRMPLLEFKQKHKDNFLKADLKFAADAIVMPPEVTLVAGD